MKAPTDKEIFNHMMSTDECDECERCGSETRVVCFGYYITKECKECGFAPMPPEED